MGPGEKPRGKGCFIKNQKHITQAFASIKPSDNILLFISLLFRISYSPTN